MRRKTVSGTMLSLLLIGMLILTFNIQPTKASGTIYIRADGSVDPDTAPISSVDNVTYTLTGNIISDGDGIVIERDNIVVDGAGYTLQGIGDCRAGIYLTGRSNVTIRNMEIKRFIYGIKLSSCSNNTIFGNDITNNFGLGIKLSSSSNNTIFGNDIKNNDSGIWFGSSSSNIISGNNIIANHFCGIWLKMPPNYNNIIYGNNLTNTHGVVVYYSSNNSISGNNIKNSEFNGVELYRSSNNSISGNNITNNGFGIEVFESSNNFIYHNNFVDNADQVHSSASTNVWDNGYLSGGNYWSDHVCTGNPSDGSQPYVIDENNTDHYPFQDPNGWVRPSDVNGDGIVDIRDIGICCKAFGSYPGDPRWNPIADINMDGIIDIYDLALIAVNFGKRLPL